MPVALCRRPEFKGGLHKSTYNLQSSAFEQHTMYHKYEMFRAKESTVISALRQNKDRTSSPEVSYIWIIVPENKSLYFLNSAEIHYKWAVKHL
jgi:hypothetical protein